MEQFVLLVEDQPTHAKLFSEMLKAAGRTSVVALQGREGHNCAIDKPVTRYHRHHSAGHRRREVIAELRSLPATETTPVLAISAVSDEAMERDCLARGADAFHAKPVRLHRFTSMVEQLLASSQSAR